MTGTESEFKFILIPEPRQAQVNLSQGNFVDITITAQNRSGRPVRVQAITAPLGMTSAIEIEPLPVEIWENWLQIRSDQPEWEFAANGVRQYTVRISLPSDARQGVYRFRLMISGVENPDEEFAESDPITFTVVGPEVNIQPFVISAAVILALIILGVIAAALLIRPRPSLKTELQAPPGAVQGQPAAYTLKIQNTGQQPAENVTADYRLPDSVAAANAFVRGETVRHCDASARLIHCDLGVLAANGQVEVSFQAIPGPKAQSLSNTRVMTVTAQMSGATSVMPVKPVNTQQSTPVSAAPGPFVVALNASTLTPVFEEDYTYQVLAWSAITTSQQMSFTFRLPVGMRYVNPLPAQCSHVREDYFTLECATPLSPAARNEDITTINLRASATAAGAASASLQAETNLSRVGGQPAARTLQTQVVNTALFFDGVQAWAQLGYSKAPKTFTVEMWVHPYSSDDGQSFIGLHREEPEAVRNLFLAGYWSGSLQVNVNGEYHNLETPKRTDRYHLAVVVQAINPNQSKVTVYVNGVEQDWQEPEDPSVCDRCKIFDSVMPGGDNPLPWVIGQDWDMGSQGKKTSDFLHGTLAEVQIWEAARSKDQIQESFQVRPQGNEPGLAAYYRLEPLTPDSDTLVSRVASAPAGKSMGAKWTEAEPLYGTALRFNGISDSLAVPGLQLQNMQADANGQVEVTMAGWMMVDAIPSQQEWVLGSTVPTVGTLGLAAGASPETIAFETPSATDQAELAASRSELLAAQQAAIDLGVDTTQISASRYNARQRLILALYYLVNDSTATASPDIAAITNLLKFPVTLQSVEATTAELGSLSKAAGVTQDISTTVSALQTNLAHINQYTLELNSLGSPQAGAAATTAVAAPGATAPLTSAEQGAALLKSLLENAQKELKKLDDAANSGSLSPAEVNSPNAGTIAPARLDEYRQTIAPISSQIQSLLTVLLANQAPNQPDLQAASQKVGAFQTSLLGREQALRAELANLNINGLSIFVFPQGDPRFVQDSARLVILDSYLQTISALNNLLTQSALLGVQSISAASASTSTVQLIPPLPSDAQLVAERAKLNLLILDEWVSYYTNLKKLVQTAEKSGLTALVQRSLPRLPAAAALNDPNVNTFKYIQAGGLLTTAAPYTAFNLLVQVDRQERDLVTVTGDDAQAGAERIQAFQNLQDTQTNLDSALTNLLTWLQSGNDKVFQQTLSSGSSSALPVDVQKYVASLATAQYNLKRYNDAKDLETKVQAAQDRVTAAQARVDAAQAQADSIQQASQQAQGDAAERQALEDEVAQANLAVSSAKTAPEQQAAQARLAAAQSNLLNSLVKQYTSLQSNMDGVLVREPVLSDLGPRLNVAVDRATEAAFSAVRRYSVERWIGPWLDFILGTRTPRQTPQEAIRPAALLAAQVALKTKADSDVDIAQLELKTTLEKQNALANSGSNAALRQRIIDQINAYLESLNKDVNSAQKKLDDALAAQQGDQGESKIPLVLAEALSQTVADQVTNETIRLTPYANTRYLLSSSATLVSQAKADVRGQIASALEAARRPLRVQLYYQTAFLLQRLDRELASNGLKPQERQIKITLRAQLAASNTALLRLLNAQNVLLKPSNGLNTLVGQVADASQSAASVDALLKTFEDALGKANQTLKVYIAYAQGAGLFGSTGRSSASGTASAGASSSTNSSSSAAAASGAASAGATGQSAGAAGGAVSNGGAAPGTTSGATAGSATAGSATADSGGGVTGGAGAPTATPTPLLTGVAQTGVPTASAGQSVTSTQTTPLSPSLGTAAAIEPLNLWVGLMVDADGHMMLAARAASGTWTWQKDEKPMPVLQWVHYAIVLRYDARTGEITDYQLYRNGSPVKGDVSGETPSLAVDALACPAGFYIGGLCDTSGRYFFAGRIDEVRVWNRALTLNEIEAWRKLPGISYDEVAYWPFDDGPGRSGGACPPGQTCDMGLTGDYNLIVTGPAWLDAEAGLTSSAASRP